MLMRTRLGTALLSLTIALFVGGAALRAQSEKSVTERIRHELLRLPYYGVFDFLAFSYQKGTVTLKGYAYRPTLKEDAERAMKRVAGVDEVDNQIEVLPVSPNDEDLRWKAYYAIYGDPFLSRYAPGGGVLWGHRHAFGSQFYPFGAGPFAGLEVAGDYPIHIVVNKGRIVLLGVVDSQSDKQLAETRAREVPLSFGVDNQLMVDKSN